MIAHHFPAVVDDVSLSIPGTADNLFLAIALSTHIKADRMQLPESGTLTNSSHIPCEPGCVHRGRSSWVGKSTPASEQATG